MIATLLKIARTNLRRDRAAQVMVFVLPIVFFSIFAMIFGRMTSNSTPRVRVAVVDEDRTSMSAMLVEAMHADESLTVADSSAAAGAHASAPLTRDEARKLIREGNLPLAVVIPRGWGATFPNLNGKGMKVDVLIDASDPIGRRVIVGVLQRCAAVVLRGGPAAVAAAQGTPGAAPEPMSLVATNVSDGHGDTKRRGRMVSFYAAGIGVMFLLFSCAGAGGALLEEQESGTLERVISTRAGMRGLLLARWLHITLTGVVQLTVMFLWGMLAFRLDFLPHLPGFFVMTVVTAGAAAALGLVLATMSRTRGQLQGYANLIILPMSALGGSMFPRFLMGPALQKIGLVTFNAWALDGYLKVFWRELPLTSLAPQLGVLAGLTVVFLGIARMLARRWEAA